MINFIQTDIINELDKTGYLYSLEMPLNQAFKEYGQTDTLQKYYWCALYATLFQVCQNQVFINRLNEKGMSAPEFLLLLEQITDFLYLSRGRDFGLLKLPEYKECDIQALTKNCTLPIDHTLMNTLTDEIYSICYEVAEKHIDFDGVQIVNLDMMVLTGNFAFYSILASVWATVFDNIPLHKIKNVGMWLVVAIVYGIANKIYVDLKPNTSKR